MGRSALDAAELTNVGVNYLREHMLDTDRIHYAYLNVGGKAPNVVQSEAVLKYFVRSKNNPEKFSGRTEGNKIVLFDGDDSMTGNFVMVHITEAQTFALKGDVVADEK